VCIAWPTDQDLIFVASRCSLRSRVASFILPSAKYSADLVRRDTVSLARWCETRRISAPCTALDPSISPSPLGPRLPQLAATMRSSIWRNATSLLQRTGRNNSRLLHGLAYKTYVKDSHKYQRRSWTFIHPGGLTLYELIVGCLSKQNSGWECLSVYATSALSETRDRRQIASLP
jgi:hypothetical protein